MSLVYRFSKDVTDGRGDMKALLGGKGAGLAEMCRIGVPVPPGFTITTEAYRAYMDAGQSVTEMLNEQVQHALRWLSQLLDFDENSDATPDDGPDALEGAIHILERMLGKSSQAQAAIL